MAMIGRLRNVLAGCLLSAALCAVPQPAHAGVFVSITIAPPVLPVYTQPACPMAGYLWSPGYWAYGPYGYYWVPGVWIAAPQVGYLWTPGYWGFGGGAYLWHGGYWGPHVGFYGGVNYGFGFFGGGFVGGGWSGGVFRYNTAVMNVNTTIIHNTYIDRTVVNNVNVNNRVAFNGPGGTNARPTPQEQAAMREPHVQPTAVQMSHERTASTDRAQLASVNHGRPATVAMDAPNGHRFNQQGQPAARPAMATASHPLAANSGAPHTEMRAQQRPANSVAATASRPQNTAPNHVQKPAPPPRAEPARPAPRERER